MKRFKTFKYALVYLVGAALFHSASWAGDRFPDPKTYLPTVAEVIEHKAFYDDPRPILETFGPKQVLPPELYKHLTYDIKEMKSAWAELVGFRAPDVVGKIAPEIKPGKYTYKDLEEYPGFKELMFPELYKQIKPGGPPFAGSIPEFEIIPTRQYYFSLPIAEASKRNMGKTQLDEKGYIKAETWLGGYPFPRPSGEFRAQQIMYNIEDRYINWDNSFWSVIPGVGITKELKEDFVGVGTRYSLKFAGRLLMEPYGWYDATAKKLGENLCTISTFEAPRDFAGSVQSLTLYLSPDKLSDMFMYLPFMRRIRKMTTTDTQDPMAGMDVIYDDNGGFMQKLSPTRYPYKYEVIEEREYLVVAATLDGSEYLSSEGYEWRNVKMERRPMYVVMLTQLDPNYVYSKRVFYVDRETFWMVHIDNFDRKGRLYRTYDTPGSFFPEMGMMTESCLNFRADHVDEHSSVSWMIAYPAFYTRQDVGVGAMTQLGK